MLKRLLLLILLSATITSCISKRQVLEENVFQCSLPALSIKVSPRLAYLGMVQSNAFSFGTGDSRYSVAHSRHEVYYFVESGSNNKASRFFIIQISRLVDANWYYLDNFHERWENPLKLDQEDHGDRTYKIACLISSLKGGDFAVYLNSKSYFMADCYALKILNRIYSQSNMLTLWYGEDCEKFRQRFAETGLNKDQEGDSMIKALNESFGEVVAFQK